MPESSDVVITMDQNEESFDLQQKDRTITKRHEGAAAPNDDNDDNDVNNDEVKKDELGSHDFDLSRSGHSIQRFDTDDVSFHTSRYVSGRSESDINKETTQTQKQRPKRRISR